MSTFKHYLAESTDTYAYRIKVAGELDNDFANKLETAMQKFEVAKISAGKKTPIQEMPLDFPYIKNTEVSIFEVETNYPASVFELKDYLANALNLAKTHIVVKKPGEPTEEYQEQMNTPKDEKDFKAVLQNLEYEEAEKINKDEHTGDKYNQSLLKELLKDRQEKFEIAKKEKTQEIQSKESEGSLSALKPAHKGPKKGNPDPMKG